LLAFGNGEVRCSGKFVASADLTVCNF
jgi:hypothetical protein